MIKTLITASVFALATTPLLADSHAADWTDIETQAKAEGEVTWFVWYFEDRFREFSQQFTDETGITVTIPDGDHGTNIDKFLAEAGREAGDIDVLAFGNDRADSIPTDMLMALDALPADDGRISEIVGIGKDGAALGFWGNQTGIAYDPAKISADDLPQSVEDFAAYWSANPGQMGFNYENGGSGPSFLRNIFRNLSDADFTDGAVSDEKMAMLDAGVDFFNENAANYEITASNADSLTRLSDGEFMLVPAWEDHMAGLQRSGEIRSDLAFYIPEMGMNGGGNFVGIPKNAPHPAAAQLFMAWLTSPEIQTQFNQTFGSMPMNANADDSAALIPNSMRDRQRAWAPNPFGDAMVERFIEDVVLER
ncbi:extracellular solute-binding protein [Pacificibacter marinus]|uniref:extracellular solute-binding protein n=1 Tax=Pacificibacter marinus TaxID=658057 RepID=UPI001C06B5D2|nr:extracellular solute-binding protein [Pacificibacter marinus]MBU2865997.1 extracellular solute-binding protein [Pacificibacter marinus]